jgi:drug/metabolite transporter (DMT)-like permease
MLTASALFAGMGALIYHVKILDSQASPLTASFVRVVVNLFFVMALASRNGVRQGIFDLFGDKRGSLWARGLFGSLSLITLFVAIHLVGLGEASFLNAFSAIWIAILSPIVLGQPNTKLGWCAISLGLCGLYLLYQPKFGESEFIGRSIGLASGALAGTAHMMVARAGRSNSSITVVFYFCLVATMIHVAWFAATGFVCPVDSKAWFMLITAGLLASVAQILMTKAYQIAPATMISAVNYASPVFNLMIGIFIFSTVPNRRGLTGAAVVVIAGVALPFLQGRRVRVDGVKQARAIDLTSSTLERQIDD